MTYVKENIFLCHFKISMFNEYECIVEYSGSLIQVTMILNKIEKWFGYAVDISCTVSSPDNFLEVSQIR